MIDSQVFTKFGRRCTFAGCNDNKVKAEFYKQPNGDFVLSVSAGYTLASQGIDQYFSFLTTNITTTGTFGHDSTGGHQVLFIANQTAQFYKDYINRVPGKSQLTITRFDTLNNIIAATFSGVLFDRFNISYSVSLQSGHFDVAME